MKVVIDTSSLLHLVRYYLPFDKNNILLNCIKNKIAGREIIVIDKVFEECTYMADGVVVKKINLTKNLSQNTENLHPPQTKEFLHKLNNNFVSQCGRLLNPEEKEKEKEKFRKSADFRMMLFCLSQIDDSNTSCLPERILLVSEETSRNNDNKAFKKIPIICKELDIETKTLPELLEMYKDDIELEFINKRQ